MPISTTPLTPIVVVYELIVGTSPIAMFTECRDLGTKTEIIEQLVATKDGQGMIRKVPGMTTAYNVVLTRTATADLSLSNWRRQIEAGDLMGGRKNGEIVGYDETGAVVVRWKFLNAWPSQLVVDMPAGTEELTLAIETLSRG